MSLSEYRRQMDEIDRELTALFVRRMELSARIAVWKSENDVPILDRTREREKLNEVSSQVPDELEDYVNTLYLTLFSLSKEYQQERMNDEVK